jgi:sugar/nucleoside kinase (ribokinase family)
MTSKKYDVVVVGELNVDLILNQINRLPAMGKEVLAEELMMTMGSSSAIFASNLQVLGSSVNYVGKLGTDRFGEFVLSSLQQKGVNTSSIISTSTCNTGLTVVLSYGEKHAMVTYAGAMNGLTAQDIADDTLCGARHLHISSIFLQGGLKPGLKALLVKAKNFGLTTSVDPQWDPAEKWALNLQELLPYIDVFMPNLAELIALTRADNMQAAFAAVAGQTKTLVVKDGTRGAYLFDGQKIIHQPAFNHNRVVDSVGAGDSFNAGFIHYFLQDKTAAECLAYGAVTGAISTTCAGGTGAFTSLSMVQEIARSAFNFIHSK